MRNRNMASEPSTPSGGEPVVTRPLEAGDWEVVEALFGARGACGGCWCMSWRVPSHGRAWEERKGEPNRLALKQLVEGGRVHAVLACSANHPVGWCCLGPREDFPRLMASRALASPEAPGLWSVVCFFIPSRWRGIGVGGRLLMGAIDLARPRGASTLDGYPAKVGSRPMPGAFAWTGVPRLFERAGFRPLPGREGRRPIFRLDLGGQATRS